MNVLVVNQSLHPLPLKAPINDSVFLHGDHTRYTHIHTSILCTINCLFIIAMLVLHESETPHDGLERGKK